MFGEERWMTLDAKMNVEEETGEERETILCDLRERFFWQREPREQIDEPNTRLRDVEQHRESFDLVLCR